MSKLNPTAKPFRFNPKVRAFVPKSFRKSSGSTPAKANASEVKAESQPSEVKATSVEQNTAESKKETTATPVDNEAPVESWEDAADVEAKVEPKVEAPKPVQTKPLEETPKPEPKVEAEPQVTKSKSDSKSKTEKRLSKAASAKDDLLKELNENGVKIPEELKHHDKRPHLNVVFIGHVDAGKSTLSGQLLLLTGQVDQRTIEKYEREAKEKNRESWYLAFIMDTNEEERAKGKTVEVGRAHFETKKRRYTLLDAPGHKNYVPNMIAGAAQADIGVLIISARRSEFEAGFDRGGQTREHAMLAKTLGISRLVVAINKMDESTVKWDVDRYDKIKKKLGPFLKKWFKPKDTAWLPVSAYTGDNLTKPLPKGHPCSWYKGKCLLDVLDNVRSTSRDPKAGLRMPIIARYKDMGTVCALGKIESGTIYRGMKIKVMPVGATGECVGILVKEKPVDIACPGENVVLQVKGLEEKDLLSGFVVCERERPCRKCVSFEAQIRVMELLAHKPLISKGYICILHVHTVVIDCQIKKLISIVDKKTGKETKKPTFIKKNQTANVKIRVPKSIAVECSKDFSQLGRFTLRDEGKTIAIGRITKMKEMSEK
mmetsp:Transcript_3206/g.4840  ORF Transcript_3206/g.4840 Transcript_3206/m.4840 type:complete len:600 (-) Transcript_3206:177-1976(-)